MDLHYFLLKIILLSLHGLQKQTSLSFLSSTAHQSDKIGESGKPEIVEFYNKTKVGVDALDQKV